MKQEPQKDSRHNMRMMYAQAIHNQNNEMKTENRGGPGRGQGRKSAFKEKTKGVKFMCPISKVDDLKKHVNKKLGEWAKEGI